METSKSSHINYMHKDSNECQAFVVKLGSKARMKHADVGKVFKHATTHHNHNLTVEAFDAAQETLYDIIVDNIGNQNLLVTIGKAPYALNGVDTLKYIMSCHRSGGNGEKESIAATEYASMLVDIHIGITSSELRDKFNNLKSYQSDLDGTARAISDSKYCADISDMIKSLSHEHKMEVKGGIRDLPDHERELPSKVEVMLEGVVASIAADRKRDSDKNTRRALHVGEVLEPKTDLAKLLQALAVHKRPDRPELPRCSDCGVRHPTIPGSPCHALLLSEGKDVPG